MNRRHGRTAAIAILLVVALALIGACAAASDDRDAGEALVGPPSEPGNQAAGQAGTPGKVDESGATLAGDGASSLINPDQPLIVKTGTLQLEVADVPDALSKARAAIAALGGYVSGSEESNKADRPVAVITYRVPADRWDDALAALRGLASKVVGEQTQAVEVTGQVLDLGARIDNLRVTERALQAIMDDATKISDVLEVQGQLTAVRGEIEQLATQKTHLEAQAALATLTATFTAPVPVVTTAAQGWSLEAEVDRAAARLVEFGQSLASAAVWAAVVGLPTLLVVLVLAVPIAFILRRAARRMARPQAPGPLWGPVTGGPGPVGPTADGPAAGGTSGEAGAA